MTALSVIDEINKAVAEQIPDGKRVRIWLDAPVIKANRLKRPLTKKILEVVKSKDSEQDSFEEEILGNRITFNVIATEDKSAKKVLAAVTNRSGRIDILQNAKFVLEDRIVVKNKKLQSLNHKGLVWLALLNHYWVADVDVYRDAMASIQLDHRFDRILIVSDDKRVTTVFPQ